MKYLKHFESNRNRHTLHTIINSKNIKVYNDISSDWNVSRSEGTISSVPFFKFDNIEYENFFVTIKQYCYDSYGIVIKNGGSVWKGIEPKFEINVDSKNIIIDLKELLDNALFYYVNYVNGDIEIIETQANFDMMIYSYKSFLEYVKKVEELKKEYDYLFSAKDMGLF